MKQVAAGRQSHSRAGKALRFIAWCFAALPLCIFAGNVRADDQIARLATETTRPTPIVALSPSGKYLALSGSRDSVSLVDAVSGSRTLLHRGVPAHVALVWTPDSHFLVVAGPDAASIYQIPTGRRVAQLQGSGFNAFSSVSPDGRYLSFIREHNLWLATLDGKNQKPLTTNGNANNLIGEVDPLFADELGVDTHYWWSPDSKSIAFLETGFQDAQHYPDAGEELPSFRLKVVNVHAGSVQAITESSEQWPYLLRVAWHPDSRRVTAYRMNRLQTASELVLYPSDHAANDTTLPLLAEKDAYWLDAPETPVFLGHKAGRAGDQVVVSSDRSGFRHIYLYDLHGACIRDLTPPGMDVYHLHRSPDAAGGIFIEGSSGDRQERYLYRIDPATGKAAQLTTQPGWHEASLNAAGTAYIDRHSSASASPSVTWHGPEGREREIVKSASIQTAPANEFISIKTHDSTLLAARLFKPRDFNPQKKYPLIIYTYSGPQGRVVEDAWGGWQMAWNRYMVEQGYLVLAVDPRGSAGYGHSFQEPLHYRLGAQETTDLREVINYLQKQSFVDRQRLGVWGCDYGAQIAIHAMMEIPGGFKAGFADSPILDWGNYDAYFSERYLGLPKAHVADYEDSSPLGAARGMTGTLLIASSTVNPVIRDDQLKALDEALASPRNRKIVKQIHRVNFADPGYRSRPDDLATLFRAMADFFTQSL